jgi:UDP-N-acetylmuramoyl-tripeptide--D-alanyl-D-alanine ligase
MDSSLFDIFYKSSGLCTDTRAISKNCLFVCIKGDNFDGNKFALQALEKGASHVIVDNASFFKDNGKMILVENSVVYLQNLATFHRRKFDIPVIAITGSNGKTTTKELLNAVLSKKYNVLATTGNLNNHLGVPFSLLQLTDEHEIAIIEMGANRPKDIEELCSIAEPTHGMITNIGKAHLEGFKSFEGVLNTKRELYDYLILNKGEVVYNADDQILNDIISVVTKNFSYGTEKQSNIQGSLLDLNPFVQMKWHSGHYSSEVLQTQMVGKYNYYNFLAAIAFGVKFNIENSIISSAIMEYVPDNQRSQVKKTNKNTLIIDCYNANPSSMINALESFSMNEHESKLVILGDMGELGDASKVEHQNIIEFLEEKKLNAIVVGHFFSACNSTMIKEKFNATPDLESYLKQSNISNHLILLKGSRSMGLEILTQHL